MVNILYLASICCNSAADNLCQNISSQDYVSLLPARIWCSICSFPATEYWMFHAVEIDLAGVDMVLSEEQQRTETTNTKATNSGHDPEVQGGHEGTEPITEISDKDYRSFCLPCDALETMDEHKKGS